MNHQMDYQMTGQKDFQMNIAWNIKLIMYFQMNHCMKHEMDYE